MTGNGNGGIRDGQGRMGIGLSVLLRQSTPTYHTCLASSLCLTVVVVLHKERLTAWLVDCIYSKIGLPDNAAFNRIAIGKLIV